MKTRMHGIGVLAACAAAVLGVGIPAAFPQDLDAYGDGYGSGEAGRVRYHEGGASILRAPGSLEADRAEETVSNAPIFAGDRILTGYGQRVEIQLSGASIIRIDRDSEVSFEALPRPYAKFRDNTVIGLAAGRIQIGSVVAEDEEFRVDTSEGSIYLLGDGEFRIDAGRDGLTRVVARRGVAEVVGSGGSVLVRGGMETTLYAGAVPSRPAPVHTYALDEFDRWVASRDDAYRGAERLAGSAAPPAEVLPYEVRPYSRELSAYGSWIDTPDYGWVWAPSIAVSGWRPYWDGYWAWGPRGYFWVSYEPWGWAPYRYGRWAWYGGRWCWIPGSVFGGAWVSWSWGSAWIGWAPLGYWGGPVYVGGPLYHDWYNPHCWTFVHPHDVAHRHVRRVAVPVDRVGAEVRRNAVVVRAPDVSPRRIAVSADAREAAARAAALDRVARVERSTVERRDGSRMGLVDERIRSRDAAGDTARRPVRSDDRRAVTPRLAPSGTRTEPGRGDRVAPTARPFQRRILEDPKPEAGSPSRETPRAQPRRSDGEGRVKDLYDRMSGPRRPREVPPRGESVRPAPRSPEQRPRTDPRMQPAPERRSTQSQSPPPRVQPSPRPAPKAPRAAPSRPSAPNPPRAEPKRGSSDGGRGSGKKSGGSKERGERKR